MVLIRVVTFLHLAVYLGIMWYGWQSYKLLRKKSWRYMGIGFTIFLLYRIRQLVKQLIASYPIDTENTFLPFVGSVFLLIAFRMLRIEHEDLFRKLIEPGPLRSGAQPVDYWLSHIRGIVREEVSVVAEKIKEIVK